MILTMITYQEKTLLSEALAPIMFHHRTNSINTLGQFLNIQHTLQLSMALRIMVGLLMGQLLHQ